jgi:hypothetical protein
MLVPRPTRTTDPIDQNSETITLLIVLSIFVFLGFTYAFQTFLARLDENGNRRPVPVQRLVDT